jgi:hypothetical protein
MPPDEPNLRAVEARMIALVRCVFAKAASDEEFAGQLKRILVSDELPAVLRPKIPSAPKRAVFDPVAFLSRNDTDRLRLELAHMAPSDLADIARKHRCMNTKSVKLADPDALIASILSYAERKMNQGRVFLRSPQRDEKRGDEAAVPNRASLHGSAYIKTPETKETHD